MDPLSVSGLNQPSVNLGGLLGMSSLSGNPTTMSGGTQGASGGSGMTGGMDLAQLLEMLNQQQGEQSAIGLGQPLGSPLQSLAQQQASGQMMGNLGQGSYLTAGGMQQGPGGGVSFGNTDADPLAIIQKVLGLAQKGVNLTGNSNTPLASPVAGGEDFDPTGQMQSQGVRQYRAGEMQDLSGLTDLQNQESLFRLSPPQDSYFLFDEQGGGTSLPPGAEGMGGGGGFNPTLGNALGVAGGLAGLAGGIQSENPYGITGGALATAGNAASMLGYPGVGGAIGGLGGPLSLASGVQSGNPMSLASGALQTYQTVAQLAQYFPELGQYLPTLGQAASQALQAIAPGVAETLGLGASAAAPAATAGAAGAAEGGAAAGGTAVGGAALGVAALPAAILGGVFMKKEADEMASLYKGMKETVRKRQDLPGNVNDVMQAMQLTAGLPADIASIPTQDLMQTYQSMLGAIPDIGNIRQIIANPSDAPSRIPRLDTSGLQQLNQQYANVGPLGIAALQDEFARRGLPMEQYWNPLSENDLLGLYANPSLTPEQFASIGPGNMLPSLQALMAGRPLANLPPALPGVGQARLSAAQATPGNESRYGQYFLNPQQQQELAQRQQMYPGEEAARANVGQTEGGPSWAPQTQSPFQLWQQMLGMNPVPQTPEGMYGQPQAPQVPQQMQPQMPPVTGIPTPQNPAQALSLLSLLSRTPGFGAQGNVEDPYLPLLFAQYGLA